MELDLVTATIVIILIQVGSLQRVVPFIVMVSAFFIKKLIIDRAAHIEAKEQRDLLNNFKFDFSAIVIGVLVLTILSMTLISFDGCDTRIHELELENLRVKQNTNCKQLDKENTILYDSIDKLNTKNSNLHKVIENQ